MENTQTQPEQAMHHQSSPLAGAATDTPRLLDSVPQRVGEIAMLRGLGYSYREIGRQFSVTPQAVSLMLSRHRRSLKSLGSAVELNNLSARAVNALGRHGIKNREQARNRNILELLGNERNCGRKTLEEIASWLNDRTED